MSIHEFVIDDDDGTTVVFVCPVDGCGRRVVLRRGDRRPVVITPGDFFAAHHGAVGPIRLGLERG